ncbi:FtsW/RodA/SpoVE family cell cycle protein [Lacrimispora saccharolytica]|uniref:Cell cycle protein n=1 Tax=Lacrimispora saccharolytica (strain ATCC 35040 / DSM 2544 / NRCC 2533 / WM1) TaxID=610130 RepID=D9R363_LACSW|nr:FtsW/RodA/SpoVE family cell cycle protein [Lacrimispora saccharolytica]ADL04812.1 cell cycle protein [[Clostridium] saccharolyticum WM1]QRV20975.1 FtsW/RodA/SpoVE family cell cycle protein [Lacrimispora saccharolytica]
MINLIIDVSRYLMILLIALYTYFNFRFFSLPDEIKKRKICGRQNFVMFLIHLLAYLIIWLETGDEKMLVFYAAQVVFFFSYLILYRLIYRNVSRLLVNNMCMLLTVGFLMLTRLSFDRAIKQFVIVTFAALVTFVIPFVIDRVWQLSKIPWVYGIVGLLLLGIVCITGTSSYGAQLSLEIGGYSFQPSEFVKISYVFFIATMFYRSTSIRTVLTVTAAAALHVLILVASRDLGSALLFFVTYVFMLFVATGKWRYLLAGAGGGSFAAVFAFQLFSHVRTRVSAWLNPWSDIAGKGYQITQSLFAIGTGGWFGMGLYRGMPRKIPVVEKDFIFSAVSEELGGIFALCVLLICLGCFLQFMMIASQMQAVFYKLIAFGLGTIYITQVFLTVGGVTKFIPSTGVTLPLISYGGSSILSTFIIFGIIQGLYILKRNEEEEDKYEG